jgi:hypothetical protein
MFLGAGVKFLSDYNDFIGSFELNFVKIFYGVKA